LLSEHLNATIQKYTDAAQLPDRCRKGGRKVQNIINLITSFLTKLKPHLT
jgi:hypothetical protein